METQVYKLIGKAVNNSYAPMVESIIGSRRYLDRSDIIQDVYIYFIEKDYINKYNSDKGKLSSYVYRFTWWYLNVLRRKGYNRELLFSDLSMENDNGETVEFEIQDFNNPESLLLDKTKERDIRSLKAYMHLNK